MKSTISATGFLLLTLLNFTSATPFAAQSHRHSRDASPSRSHARSHIHHAKSIHSSHKLHSIRAANPQNLGWYVCPPGTAQGSIACVSATGFVICNNWTQGSLVQPVAAGTECHENTIVPVARYIPAANADGVPVTTVTMTVSPSPAAKAKSM